MRCWNDQRDRFEPNGLKRDLGKSSSVLEDARSRWEDGPLFLLAYRKARHEIILQIWKCNSFVQEKKDVFTCSLANSCKRALDGFINYEASGCIVQWDKTQNNLRPDNFWLSIVPAVMPINAKFISQTQAALISEQREKITFFSVN